MLTATVIRENLLTPLDWAVIEHQIELHMRMEPNSDRDWLEYCIEEMLAAKAGFLEP